MNKYVAVYNMVNRATDSPTLRIFFSLYLMATSDAERKALNERLWLDAEQFSEQEREALQEDMRASFQRLPELVNQLHEKVKAAILQPSQTLTT